MSATSQRFERVGRDFAHQIERANMLVKIALEGLRRSGHVLDLTCQLRFAALNVFVKTERSHEGTNVFAPISREFMTLVRSYEELTTEFGAQSSQFIQVLMNYAKCLRRYRQVVLGICELGIAQKPKGCSEDEMLRQLSSFFRSEMDDVTVPGSRSSDFLSHHACFRRHCDELSSARDTIRRGYRKLRRIDKELATLSNLGEYAAQVSMVEASRLEGREDLIAAFENISHLLHTCLEELNGMRSWFSQGIRIIDSLSWEITGL